MNTDPSALDIASTIIRQDEARLAEQQHILNHLAGRGLSTEFAANLVKTFEQDLALSRANLARLKS